ncbi:hypothetical protein OHA77_08840 [Streptosporangium sp. NBC_01639]|uniref:hypothetical protein n=1 Tax=Streptosporangium sp. NBC_01639 TaxID=2975948 RepID=UPI00387052ED|nr:hypothetical protein OHA77_08840 [Streptosporangium sp. NBC_01639]
MTTSAMSRARLIVFFVVSAMKRRANADFCRLVGRNGCGRFRYTEQSSVRRTSVRKFKQGALLTLATMVAFSGSIFTSSSAMAASSPVAACGGGSYHVIDKHDLGKAVIYLMYNGTTNCVVTWKDSPDSKKVVAGILVQGNTQENRDADYYQYYAGPVKASAAGKCIIWGGAYGAGDYDYSGSWYRSPWEHCG